MAVYSIGELAGRAERRAQRRYEPVRRGSREKGTFEAGWYRAPQRDQYGLMCDGVRLVDEHIKKARAGTPWARRRQDHAGAARGDRPAHRPP